MANDTEMTSTKPPARSLPNGKINPQSQPLDLEGILHAVTNWVFAHFNAIGIVFGIFVVLGLGYAGYSKWNEIRNESAMTAFYPVEKQFNERKQNFDRAKFQAMMPKLGDDKDKKLEPASGDLAKDYGSVTADLEKVMSEHSGTPAAAQAGILLGNLYLEYKQPEKAVEVLKGLPRTSDLSGTLAQITLGRAHLEKQDCASGEQTWQSFMGKKESSFFEGDLLLRLGVCFEATQQAERAREFYTKASQNFSESAAGKLAKNYLRAMDVQASASSGK